MEKEEVLKLGTLVKTQVILEDDNPTNVKITIKDPSASEKISSVVMTKKAPNVFQHVWQSSKNSDAEGAYHVIIDATYADGTSREDAYFTLEDIDD